MDRAPLPRTAAHVAKRATFRIEISRHLGAGSQPPLAYREIEATIHDFGTIEGVAPSIRNDGTIINHSTSGAGIVHACVSVLSYMVRAWIVICARSTRISQREVLDSVKAEGGGQPTKGAPALRDRG